MQRRCLGGMTIEKPEKIHTKKEEVVSVYSRLPAAEPTTAWVIDGGKKHRYRKNLRKENLELK